MEVDMFSHEGGDVEEVVAVSLSQLEIDFEA
jgi:hypothetical protein